MLNRNMVIGLTIFLMSIFLMSAITTSVFSVRTPIPPDVQTDDVQTDERANYAGSFFVSTSHPELNHLLSSRM